MMQCLRYVPTTEECDFVRIARLQDRMYHRVPTICPERAELVTQSYQKTEGEPIILRRAKAFRHILTNMSLYIEPDALIVGNQARENFAAPIFPEYSFQWVIDELDTFSARSGDYFLITEDTKERLLQLQSHWQGITHQDEVLKNLPKVNRLAEEQGVLHRGGISMSGDGHIIPDYAFVLEVGYGGIREIAQRHLEEDEALSEDQKEYYQAVVISMGAALSYIRRLSKVAAQTAEGEEDPKRKEELLDLSRMLSGLMEGGARSFHEAVETVYLTHLLMMVESNGHSFSFGRFDQYMYPYYTRDVEAGILSSDRALELITHFFIMTNSLNKVRPWDHTQYSGGYPLYSNLMVGGMKPDGTDGTNDLTYLCIEAKNMNCMPDPNFSLRLWEGSPHELVKDAARLIRTGSGMPSVFSDEVVIPALERLGISSDDAKDYASIGCVEPGIPGKYGHRATGMTYINFGKVLEMVLHNGMDPVTGIQLLSLDGNQGPAIHYHSYEELWDAWKRALSFYFDLAVDCDGVCDRALAYHDADPFASPTVQNSLALGKTLKNGGSKYDFISQSNIGPSTVGDSLAAIKKLVFEDGVLTMEELLDALHRNFEGADGARIRQLCRRAPKFGNDDDYVDAIVADVYESYLALLPAKKTMRTGKGPELSGYTMGTSNISSYVPNGFDVGATPDGRLATKPLNEGASPCLGADREGPTAVINSVGKLPNQKMSGGQLLNMRFSPGALFGEENLEKFTAFLETGWKKNIFHNQFNVVDSATLQAARKHPEDYPDLMVRVAGYCALFTTLMPEAQEAIIARTELGWE